MYTESELITNVSFPTIQVHILYNETLKMFMVLRHDFPEFLCYYHHMLLQLIPLQCVQLRNVILSAVSHNLRVQN